MSRRPAARWLRRITVRAAVGTAAVLALTLARARPARAQAEEPAIPPPPPPPPAEPVAIPPTDPVEPPPPPPPSLEDLVEIFDDKNRVPANPALDVLDANGLTVVKPGSPKDLGTEVRALYKGGKVTPQLAIELSPYMVAYGRRASYADYRRHAYVPILYRLSVSLATTSIDEAAGPATLGALGVRVRLFDRSDWRLDEAAVTCALDAASLAKPPSKPGEAVVVVVSEDTTKEAKKVRECFEQAKQRTGSWNAEQLALGAAVSSAFPGGKLEADLRDLNAWIAWGHRLSRNALLVVASKYLFSDTRKEGETRLPPRHAASIAGEVERRSDRFGLVGSLGLGRRWSQDGGADAMTWVGAWIAQIGGGLQVRVSDGTWVELRISTQLVEGGDDALVSLANFKWNFDVKTSKAK